MCAEVLPRDGRVTAPVPPARRDCFELLGHKWTAEIVAALLSGPRRFSALHSSVRGVSDKVLSRRLAELERGGILSRAQYEEIPPRVEYRLTTIGLALRPVIGEMERWSKRYGRV